MLVVLAGMWQPDETAVGQVVAMLEQAGVPDTAVQAAVKAQLDQLQTVPEFNRTVAHVFIRLTDRPVAMRMAAGLILKNNVRRHSQTMPPEQAAALKAELLAGIADADGLIRKTVGTCVATFAGVMGTYEDWLVHWPDLMPTVRHTHACCPALCRRGRIVSILHVPSLVPAWRGEWMLTLRLVYGRSSPRTSRRRRHQVRSRGPWTC